MDTPGGYPLDSRLRSPRQDKWGPALSKPWSIGNLVEGLPVSHQDLEATKCLNFLSSVKYPVLTEGPLILVSTLSGLSGTSYFQPGLEMALHGRVVRRDWAKGIITE